MKLLLCEDEHTLSKVISVLLKKNNYTVDCAYDGEEALDYIKVGSYDAIILDVMMPKRDGFSVLKEIRYLKIKTPVIMLTAKSTLEDKLEGFEYGADDYITKPFATPELLARLKAVIRRNEGVSDNFLEFNGVKLDTQTFKLVNGDISESLCNKEFQIMQSLMIKPKSLVSLDSLLNQIYSFDEGDITTIWVYISYLRRKLKNINAKIKIKAIRNAGYILEELDDKEVTN